MLDVGYLVGIINPYIMYRHYALLFSTHNASTTYLGMH